MKLAVRTRGDKGNFQGRGRVPHLAADIKRGVYPSCKLFINFHQACTADCQPGSSMSGPCSASIQLLHHLIMRMPLGGRREIADQW